MTVDTYVHPQVISKAIARKLARLCIEQKQSFALQPDGRSWQVWAPMPEKDKMIQLIDEARTV